MYVLVTVYVLAECLVGYSAAGNMHCMYIRVCVGNRTALRTYIVVCVNDTILEHFFIVQTLEQSKHKCVALR